MFYDVYCALCAREGLTPSGAAAKIGFNRASVTMWKNTGKPPKPELLDKIAAFFDVTTDFLLEKESKEKTVTSKSNGLEEIQDTYLRLARGAQELGLDNSDVDAILALYRAHKEKKQVKPAGGVNDRKSQTLQMR